MTQSPRPKKIITRKTDGPTPAPTAATPEVHGHSEVAHQKLVSYQTRAATRKRHPFSGLIVLLIIASVLGITGTILYQKEKRTRRRQELAAMAQARQSAQDSYALVSELCSKMEEMRAAASSSSNAAAGAVRFVLDEPLGRRPVIEQPPPGVIPRRTPRKRPSATRTTVSARRADDDKPEGIMSLEELERRHRRTQKQPAEEEQAPEEEQPAPAEEPAPVAPAATPEIRTLGWDAAEMAGDIEHIAAAAVNTGTSAAVANERARNAIFSKDAAEAATELAAAATELTQSEATIRETLAKLQAVVGRMEEIRINTAAERERQAELERQRREERERRQLVRSEQESANSCRADGRTLVKRYQATRALEAAEAGLAQCRTPEGKAAFQLLVDRYRLMSELHAFVIKQLNEDPFGWGWIQGATPLDVLGADENSVQVRGKTVNWMDVTQKQYIHFLQRYTASEKIRFSVRTEQLLASAVWCKEAGVSQKAAGFTKELLKHKPEMADRVDRLLEQ